MTTIKDGFLMAQVEYEASRVGVTQATDARRAGQNSHMISLDVAHGRRVNVTAMLTPYRARRLAALLLLHAEEADRTRFGA